MERTALNRIKSKSEFELHLPDCYIYIPTHRQSTIYCCCEFGTIVSFDHNGNDKQEVEDSVFYILSKVFYNLVKMLEDVLLFYLIFVEILILKRY
jgi:hypothetical protein